MHISTLRAAGGSIAVTIPQSVAKATGLQVGDQVSFDIEAGRLVIAPLTRRKYSLQELLALQGDQPLIIDQAWDSMAPSGQEVRL